MIENKDLKRPTYIAMLDAKSAFDVVVHANLIRRLHQYEFSDQSILLINSLYEKCKAVTCVVMFYYCNVKSQVHDVMLTFHDVKSCHHDVMLTFYNVVLLYNPNAMELLLYL
jgi:hypothetical protein